MDLGRISDLSMAKRRVTSIIIGSRSAQGIATIWLPDIALPLANSNQAVILCREGGITVLIGIIDKEKILSMERLI